jgi:signal transduction histidine kinase
MQQMEHAVGLDGAERKRVEAVVETLATLRGHGESLAEVAHDARNMVTALGLYCDLLEEPGVLATPFFHYGSELRLVAAASRRLVEKLVALDTRAATGAARPDRSQCEVNKVPGEAKAGGKSGRILRWEPMPAEPIGNLAGELLATRNLLSALAGPSIALTVDAQGGALPVRLTGEDLTRVLVNLVKNAVEAMPGGGRIQLGLRELREGPGAEPRLVLTIEDNGPGIPRNTLEWVFESGYTTHAKVTQAKAVWPAAHCGLGLSITRSIVEAAGGRIHAENRNPAGARFVIELPVRTL